MCLPRVDATKITARGDKLQEMGSGNTRILIHSGQEWAGARPSFDDEDAIAGEGSYLHEDVHRCTEAIAREMGRSDWYWWCKSLHIIHNIIEREFAQLLAGTCCGNEIKMLNTFYVGISRQKKVIVDI